MRTVMETDRTAAWEALWLRPETSSPDETANGGDEASFSAEAIKKMRESALRPLVREALSLEEFDKRIATIESEIAAVWNSALPYVEKVRQVRTKKTEISLLQAGQFAFAKAGFYRAA